ncbi:MAG: hypothetical protein K6B14_04410 [Lachnospiraceae bacterium]|nr:hypothetical protein [Lachnospiraceae bacterium]
MSAEPIIIRIHEANSDGNGTPCEVDIYVDRKPSDDDIATVSDAISTFQEEMKDNSTEWETKTLAQVAAEKFISLGYDSGVIKPNHVIEVKSI